MKLSYSKLAGTIFYFRKQFIKYDEKIYVKFMLFLGPNIYVLFSKLIYFFIILSIIQKIIIKIMDLFFI